MEDSFSEGQHFVEPIFYSAGAGFWFDYLSLAPRLYQLDKNFLSGIGYEIEAFSALLREMQAIFKTRLRDFIRAQRKNIRKVGLVASPLPCFIYSPSDIPTAQRDAYERFVERFSVQFGEGPAVSSPLDYHPCKARPALRLSKGQIFAPLVPTLCEQLYESPFYAIVQDKSYFADNANNRGLASELMLHEILEPIKHLELLRDVKLKHRGQEIGQIDLAAVFGATAIVFEIKTKRLTQASKNGSTKDLIKDIQAGILEAQHQLAGVKASLLSKNYDSLSSQTGKARALEDVRQVVCVSVMTHEIPAYPLLIRTILEDARVTDIVPITIFDLKVTASYLGNGFDFVYYFATRSLLDKHLMYGTESALLAFHLKKRLTVPERIDLVFIDDAVGQTIDADYPNRDKKLSLKFGIRIIDEIIEDIIVAGDATLFRVFSVLRGMSRGSARELGKLLKRVEGLLRKDGLAHDATMVFGDVALTFILANDPMLARERFERLRQKRAHENQYAQEYMLVLSPPHLKRHDRFDRNSHHFKIRAVAMRQNSVSDARILAFSPRIPEKDWAVKDEGHGRD